MRFRYLLLLATLFAAVPAVAPATGGDQRPAVIPAIQDYRLGAGDKLHVTVFRETALSGDFPVNASGNLSMPVIGDVPALGKTTSELTGMIRDKLADGYLKDPKVSVSIMEFRPFYILGEVRTPGQYPFVIGLTVQNAVARAAGFTSLADKAVVWLRREGEAKEKRFRVTPDLQVHPGDTIRVPERMF